MITPELLLAAVAAAFGVELAELTGQDRRRHVAEARQAAAWVLRRAFPRLGLVAIGAQLGRRDHTTIIHAIERVEQRIAADPELGALLELLVATPPPPRSEPRPIFIHPAAPPRERPPAPALNITAGEIWWVAQARAAFIVEAA